jgi:hypothetical protein
MIKKAVKEKVKKTATKTKAKTTTKTTTKTKTGLRASVKIKAKTSVKTKAKTDRVYTMIAYLVSGPVNAGEAGKVISRTVEIKESQSLESLHKAIFKAFGREDEHLYEFIIGKNAKYRGDIEYPVKSRKYYITATNSPNNPLEVISSSITIESLDLQPEERFLYIFDFGDEWIHIIDTVSTDGASDGKKYPRVTEKEGEAPHQYAEEGEEGEE